MEKFYKFYAFWVNMEKVFAWGNDGGGGGGPDAIYIYVALYFVSLQNC